MEGILRTPLSWLVRRIYWMYSLFSGRILVLLPNNSTTLLKLLWRIIIMILRWLLLCNMTSLHPRSTVSHHSKMFVDRSWMLTMRRSSLLSWLRPRRNKQHRHIMARTDDPDAMWRIDSNRSNTYDSCSVDTFLSLMLMKFVNSSWTLQSTKSSFSYSHIEIKAHKSEPKRPIIKIYDEREKGEENIIW